MLKDQLPNFIIIDYGDKPLLCTLAKSMFTLFGHSEVRGNENVDKTKKCLVVAKYTVTQTYLQTRYNHEFVNSQKKT